MEQIGRRQALGALAGVGVLGLGAAACGNSRTPKEAERSTSDGPPRAQQDREIVAYALTLEKLENTFYREVIQSGELRGGRELELIKRIGENEQEHVDALTATLKSLGAKPGKTPGFDFSSVLSGGRPKILDTAATLENTGASAYLGQAPRIMNKDLLSAALSIHTVEARHASALNRLTGQKFVPQGAFATGMSMSDVRSLIKPFLVAE